MKRIHIDQDLRRAADVALDRVHANRVLNVLRMRDGAPLAVFNGRDGEWRARLAVRGRKAAHLHVEERLRPQPPAPPLDVLLAPIKRLDYAVQKSVEMGAGRIRPVETDHTQARARADKTTAYAVEAAEQCGALHVPPVDDLQPLASVLDAWNGRPLIFCDEDAIFCDEDAEEADPLATLRAIAPGPLGVLVGPEGGFSARERERLRALPFVTPLPLGPRILRADTALVAALALVQATLGDWAGERR